MSLTGRWTRGFGLGRGGAVRAREAGLRPGRRRGAKETRARLGGVGGSGVEAGLGAGPEWGSGARLGGGAGLGGGTKGRA